MKRHWDIAQGLPVSHGGADENLKYTDTSVNQLNIGINPGIAISIMPNVGAEVSFGVAGFTYNWEKAEKKFG